MNLSSQALRILVILTLACLSNTQVQAQAQEEDSWDQTFHIYLLGPTIEGVTGIGPLDADVSIDAGTVFDSLQGAFLGMYSAEKNGLGVFLDVVYMDLEADIQGPAGAIEGSIGNRQFTSMMAATWRLNESWRLMGGAIYNRIKMGIERVGPVGSGSRSRTESWWDPYVGAHYSTPISDQWRFDAMGGVGGFGVGSDLTWTVTGSFAYQLTERSHVTLLYRYMDFDYEDGAGADRFRFDVKEHGPALGWLFEF